MKVNATENTVLHLSLDHEDCVYRAQRWIKGTVTVEYPSLQSDGNSKLSISFIGKEQTWTTPTLLNSCRGQEKEDIIFDEEQILHDFNQEQPNGLTTTTTTTTLPFAVFLPGSLAPSFYFEDDGPRGCSVSYELTAWYGTHVSVTRPVHIVGPTLSTKTHPYHLAPLSLSPDLLLAVHMENTHVAKGRSLPVSLSMRGPPTAEVTVQVMEEIHWKTYCHTAHAHKHIQSEQRLAPTNPPEWSDVERMKLEMEQELHAVENFPISIPIPSTARDTYLGTKRIQIQHFLCIRILDTKEATHTIPLIICDPPLNSHHHHSPSKESLQDIMTTVWPGDVVPVHENSTDASEHSSCPPIHEEVAEVAE
ncbi:hypothetical protein FisN_31Lh068 [Fistulifera solaris]|uniref:Arrestin C-terminal-like domain-containing protein n=1 Tax=Fistulifera solaris TaxID=1519565 RepID=A0A1Z5K778_FISSO|nr:hypothetical protein FisN_31Lh068 [Fistulifera solaris]|eukprot:GAX21778.1 hypothetical protein FisN_31Lh068 [Fistulifera solaris]